MDRSQPIDVKSIRETKKCQIFFRRLVWDKQGGVDISKLKHGVLTPKRDKLTHLFNEKTILSKSAYRQQWSRSF